MHPYTAASRDLVALPSVTATAALAALGAAMGALSWWTSSAWVAVLVPVAVASTALLPSRRRLLPWALAPVVVVACAALAGQWVAAVWLVCATAAATGLSHLVGQRSEAAERSRVLAEDRAEALTVRDELTGCVNQRGLHLLGAQVLHDVRRRGDALHASVVRVQRLDVVDRELGREAADEVLLVVAEALRAHTRGTDVVAGGPRGEFRVLGPGSGVPVGETERRVRGYVLDRMPVPLHVWPCLLGIGTATLEPWDDGDLSDLLRRAEEDLTLRVAMRAPSVPEPPLRRYR